MKAALVTRAGSRPQGHCATAVLAGQARRRKRRRVPPFTLADLTDILTTLSANINNYSLTSSNSKPFILIEM